MKRDFEFLESTFEPVSEPDAATRSLYQEYQMQRALRLQQSIPPARAGLRSQPEFAFGASLGAPMIRTLH